ncbi:MAG: hypothetical protein HYZ50_21100 [Deltaproteobacteria bacterium]|nr:hypothetical protein [Deltaproteobacteria bacterium]
MKAVGWLNGLWTLAVAGGLLAASCATSIDRQKVPLAGPQPLTFHTQSPIPQAKLQVTYAHVPLHFEPNQGQTDEQVHFLSRARGYTLFLTSTEAVLALRQNSEARIQKSESQHPTPHTQPPAVLRMQFIGANLNPQIAGHEELPGQVNYFIGNNPDKWRTNIPTFAKVQYQDVYPGVDLVYYGNQQQLEFDFVVAPGADPKAIRLTFDGLVGAGLVPIGVNLTAKAGFAVPSPLGGEGQDEGKRRAKDPLTPLTLALSPAGRGDVLPLQSGKDPKLTPMPQESPLQITDNGDLIVSVAGGEVRLRKPQIYQEIDGVRQPISGHYVIIDSEISSPLIPNPQSLTPKVGFQIAAYDTSKPLIIDPVLSYSTYLGGSSDDYAYALTPDGSGGVWVAGETYSTNFPTANPFQAANAGGYDTFVARISNNGVSTTFEGLGVDFFPNAVSDYGSIIVGHDNANPFHAVRWTRTEGVVTLEEPVGVLQSNATAVSAGGSVIVGSINFGIEQEAVFWTEAEGVMGLGIPPEGSPRATEAFGVSADGSIIVGGSTGASGQHPFRWTTAEGIVSLGHLGAPNLRGDALDVSADGAVVVGVAGSTFGGLVLFGNEAFRWTAAEGMVGLGDLPGSFVASIARAVSANGSVVVGESANNQSRNEAFRWTAAEGMVGLGILLNRQNSYASDVSADGSIVVGLTDGGGFGAFVWDATHGMRSLKSVLVNDLGLDLTGWTLTQATSISADGRTIVGYGVNSNGQNEAWMVRNFSTGLAPPSDSDSDGIPDATDNCPSPERVAD